MVHYTAGWAGRVDALWCQIVLTIRYDTIRYDTVDLRALKSWRDGQLNLAHGQETTSPPRKLRPYGGIEMCIIIIIITYFNVFYNGNGTTMLRSIRMSIQQLQDRQLVGWLRGTVVERRSLAGELSLSCARPIADGWPLVWVNRPL